MLHLLTHSFPTRRSSDLEDLRFAPGVKPLIDGITLQLSPGTRSIVMGPNGAGKSLFLRLLAGLLQPTAGRVTYGGRAADPAALRRIDRKSTRLNSSH